MIHPCQMEAIPNNFIQSGGSLLRQLSDRSFPTPKMSGKYAFTKSLKEVRFLFCQTSEHSAAIRFVVDLTLLPGALY